jgi:hypothetical protein
MNDGQHGATFLQVTRAAKRAATAVHLVENIPLISYPEMIFLYTDQSK